MNAGEVIQSRYRLEQALGKGGMATVWKAHDLRLERPVALKCLMAPLTEDPMFLVRFFQEAQQVARVSHPNVVHVLDFGEGEECPYLVMEYLPGGTLEDIGKPMEPKQALTLIAGAAAGAGAAHEVGLVHRDLKPGNIMFTEDGTPKIADFGIAVSQAQERLTATGTAIGSPHYVSPEQASGRPTGPPSDVYSLGVVLYELLTGRRPFELENATALAIAHVEETPEPPSSYNSSLPPAIDATVMRCLEKDPEKRFANGAEMAAALQHLAMDSDTAPFATVAAPATAATAAAPAAHSEEGTPVSRNTRRGVAVSLLAALFVGLLVFGVMALGGGGDEERAIADVQQDGSINAKESPEAKAAKDDLAADEESYEETTTTSVVSTPEPADTPAAEEETTTDEEEEAAREEETYDDKDEDWTEPSPEPTSEPEPEPTSSP